MIKNQKKYLIFRSLLSSLKITKFHKKRKKKKITTVSGFLHLPQFYALSLSFSFHIHILDLSRHLEAVVTGLQIA